MRIVLLGDFSDNLDEGYKNVGHYLAEELAKNNDVYRMNVKQAVSSGFWRNVAAAKPQIVHAFAQPTNSSLVFCHILRRYWTEARTIVSALRAERYFGRGQVGVMQRAVLRLFQPNLILVQDPVAETVFSQAGCSVRQLPNGVDLQRFRPAEVAQRHALRQKYRLRLDQPVVLHVGHLRLERNLSSLRKLAGKQIQVVVVGSTYMKISHSLIKELETGGVHIIKGYQPHVEELYMLADCYVFPTEPGYSLTMPLSVLEAMACNLPVITMRFTGLIGAFKDEHGLRFVESTDDILDEVQNTLRSTAVIKTRDMVSRFSWAAVATQLQNYYRDVVN